MVSHLRSNQQRLTAHVESARSAVLVLPPVRFCGPLAEPAVRLSTQRALHGYRPVAVLKPREAVFLRPGSDSG